MEQELRVLAIEKSDWIENVQLPSISHKKHRATSGQAPDAKLKII
jgi:hypothetical protein